METQLFDDFKEDINISNIAEIHGKNSQVVRILFNCCDHASPMSEIERISLTKISFINKQIKQKKAVHTS